MFGVNHAYCCNIMHILLPGSDTFTGDEVLDIGNTQPGAYSEANRPAITT
jgi:hypothetical protein